MGRKDITILLDIRTAEYTMFEVNGKRPGKMGAQTTTKTGMVTKRTLLCISTINTLTEGTQKLKKRSEMYNDIINDISWG